MKVKTLLTLNKSITLSDILDYIDGLGRWETTFLEIVETTGLDHPLIDLDTSEEYSKEEVLNADIIEDPSTEDFYDSDYFD